MLIYSHMSKQVEGAILIEFQGELEGSKLYRTLYDDAVKYYKLSVNVQR